MKDFTIDGFVTQNVETKATRSARHSTSTSSSGTTRETPRPP